jgi:hypothetical protein
VASSKVRRKRRVLLSQEFEIDAVERIESPMADCVLFHVVCVAHWDCEFVPWLDADATTCARHPDMGRFRWWSVSTDAARERPDPSQMSRIAPGFYACWPGL